MWNKLGLFELITKTMGRKYVGCKLILWNKCTYQLAVLINLFNIIQYVNGLQIKSIKKKKTLQNLYYLCEARSYMTILHVNCSFMKKGVSRLCWALVSSLTDVKVIRLVCWIMYGLSDTFCWYWKCNNTGARKMLAEKVRNTAPSVYLYGS